MCGIFGAVSSRQPLEFNDDLNRKILDALKHRGPDDSGVWSSNNSRAHFIHTRLTILDLSPLGRQPMTSRDGRFTIVYNGEIYNYIEIRDCLQKKGYDFTSTTDTEVVLYAFAEWGKECARRFVGMFAFAIWDNLEKTLCLFRDRVGVKPLYYCQKDGTLFFASELRAIRCHPWSELKIDLQSIGQYLQHGYVPAPNTIYRNVHKLEPGHFLTFDSSGNSKTYRYWNIEDFYSKPELKGDESDLVNQLEDLMTKAFRYRMVSDVPLGIFLSGGIDSSLVTAMLQAHSDTPLKTFTIGFENSPQDESRWALEVAKHLGTEHTTRQMTSAALIEAVKLLPLVYDEPISDNSCLPTLLLCQTTSEKVKVALSGDGADELFCGYSHYQSLPAAYRNHQRIPGWFRHLLGSCTRVANSRNIERLALLARKGKARDVRHLAKQYFQDTGFPGFYESFKSFWCPEEISRLLDIDYKDPIALHDYGHGQPENMMLHEFNYFLPDDIFTKVDRASMFYSLEAREPFMDESIIEFAARLPIEMKCRGSSSKHILRSILKKYLPDQLIDRPKRGFVVPIHDWMQHDLHEMTEEYLNSKVLRQESVFDVKNVEALRSNFHCGLTGYAYKVWSLLVFQLWHEKWTS